MVDIGLGGFHDRRSARSERKLIKFPDVTEGRLADAIALLTAPGTERELRSEAQFRRIYRASASSWRRPREGRARLSVLVGVASVASVFATATGLSAASVLPSPASHVVNTMLAPLNGGGSQTTPPPSATQPLGSATPASSPAITPTSLVAGSALAAGTNGAGANTACRHGRSGCTARHLHSTQVGGSSVAAAGGANQAVGTKRAPTSTAAATTPSSSTTSPTAPVTAATTDPGSGSPPGSGSNRGGNLGSGSTPGSGSQRAGKHKGSGGAAPGRSRGGGHHGDGSGNGSTSGGTPNGGTPNGGTGSGSHRRRHPGQPTVNPPSSSTSTSLLPGSTPDDAASDSTTA
jgi:hypothetical protein